MLIGTLEYPLQICLVSNVIEASLCKEDTHIDVSIPCRTEACLLLLEHCIHLQIQPGGANISPALSLARTEVHQHHITLISEEDMHSLILKRI
jgi:hypothetical protein